MKDRPHVPVVTWIHNRLEGATYVTYTAGVQSRTKTDGNQDGILGVCAGVEMLKVLQEENVETEYATGVVNWTKYEALRRPRRVKGHGCH